MSKYFVIRCDEDGDKYMDVMDKETLLKRLEENYYGDVEINSKMPKNSDLNYWGNSITIICGDIVSPTAVEVVKKYEI